MLTSSLKVVSRLVCYNSGRIQEIWPKAKPHIQSALDRGSNYTIDDIHTGLCSGKMQLWLWMGRDVEAAMITTIQTKNNVTYCLYLALGGSKMFEWAKHMPIVETWAKEHKCTEMRIYGRAGWAKAFGFDIDYTKMTRTL